MKYPRDLELELKLKLSFEIGELVHKVEDNLQTTKEQHEK